VNSLEQIADMVAALAVASFAWISSVAGSVGPASSPLPTSASMQGQSELGSIMRWAQQEDELPIEQVGEDTGGDIETLDEAAPPVDEGELARDVELLDQGPPASTQDDVELLDQGPAPALPVESAAPSTTTEPVTTSVAPTTTTGPVLPEGFGTGSVQVSTGSAGFPVGLEDCHVGAVTGRAYVGIGCGDEGVSSFVGHAPSFEEFPFVLDENFPFDRESVFAERGDTQRTEENVVTLVSSARDDNAAAPEVRASGASSVSLEQRVRNHKPRVKAENDHSKRVHERRPKGNAGSTDSESQDTTDRTSVESKQQSKNKGKDRVRGGTPDNENASTSSNKSKKHGGKKGKKNRAAN
jgi:hypothetical protein